MRALEEATRVVREALELQASSLASELSALAADCLMQATCHHKLSQCGYGDGREDDGFSGQEQELSPSLASAQTHDELLLSLLQHLRQSSDCIRRCMKAFEEERESAAGLEQLLESANQEMALMLEALRESDEQTAMQRRTASSKFVLNAFREIRDKGALEQLHEEIQKDCKRSRDAATGLFHKVEQAKILRLPGRARIVCCGLDLLQERHRRSLNSSPDEEEHESEAVFFAEIRKILEMNEKLASSNASLMEAMEELERIEVIRLKSCCSLEEKCDKLEEEKERLRAQLEATRLRAESQSESFASALKESEKALKEAVSSVWNGQERRTESPAKEKQIIQLLQERSQLRATVAALNASLEIYQREVVQQRSVDPSAEQKEEEEEAARAREAVYSRETPSSSSTLPASDNQQVGSERPKGLMSLLNRRRERKDADSTPGPLPLSSASSVSFLAPRSSHGRPGNEFDHLQEQIDVMHKSIWSLLGSQGSTTAEKDVGVQEERRENNQEEDEEDEDEDEDEDDAEREEEEEVEVRTSFQLSPMGNKHASLQRLSLESPLQGPLDLEDFTESVGRERRGEEASLAVSEDGLFDLVITVLQADLPQLERALRNRKTGGAADGVSEAVHVIAEAGKRRQAHSLSASSLLVDDPQPFLGHPNGQSLSSKPSFLFRSCSANCFLRVSLWTGGQGDPMRSLGWTKVSVKEILPKVLHADMDCSVKHSDWFPLSVDPAASRVSGDGGSDAMKAVKLLLSVTYRGSTTDL
ncbi:hypothetical protein GUITHDRAFT_160481 [Guillardia theta CCMP2712]|uniref:Uncharacterized protein n=2 Tax=Guillardia theta TaxID=55529 RepID=L1K568_GUITC|nr:hypothetical protein GUITHDRAFT_160481 [Guillardia theta CCMP2712]EKX55513.1 hypothetical protein GUITHDRAFT_160481 [Guillardia theta CCMP2712]|eukprot:XP_005842493.1 hypothetical protein GUITHDRAFT_160481 [Guillardia theta CCMP2712]